MVNTLENISIWLQNSGPRWAEYLLVLLTSWMIAGSLVGSDMHHNSLPSFTIPSQDSAPADVIDIAAIKKVHLFGNLDVKSSKPVVVAPQVVKASKLNIKLIGTVVAGMRSAAVVTINGSKAQQVFFTGDEVQAGVTLQSVEAAAIVLNNRGQQERISLEEGKAIVPAPSFSRPVQHARPRPGRINRSINRNHMQKQLRNFSQLLSQARVTPHFTNKKADGFTISEIVKGSLYEQIGLRNGDIIRKVNGESVVSAEQAMRMYKELQSASNIDVEIERSGSIQQVSYTIQ